MVRVPAGASSGALDDYGNTCVQVIRSRFLDFFPETGPRSLTEMYLELAGQQKIAPFVHDQDYWYDLGRHQNFLKAEREVSFFGE